MPAMPYDLEKGPYFSVLEDFLNNKGRRIRALAEMRGGVDLTRLGVLDSPSLDPDKSSPRVRARHMNEHWFGMTWDRKLKTWHKQPPTSCSSPPRTPTGYWQDWHGDAEGILRETLIRAVEVSLGIGHGEEVTAKDATPRLWPLEFFWKCQGPWFEGWVTWRARGTEPDDGQVTVILATPGNGSPLWRTPERGEPVDEYEVNPKKAKGQHGMWVVTHEHEHQFESEARNLTAPTPKGAFPLPTFGTQMAGCGDIVVVSPAERDGGVMRKGRPYKARPRNVESTIPEAVE